MAHGSSPIADLGSVARLVVETHRASPAAVVAASLGRGAQKTVGLGAFGHLSMEGDSPRARIDTPFDLASVTKPIVALTLARLQRSGVLDRREHLGDVLPFVCKTVSGDVSLDLLSAHRAGLEAHLQIFAPLLEGGSVTREEAWLIAAGSRRHDALGTIAEEGFAPIYSDMGYMLLGAAIEARCGEPLDEVVRREVLSPLGLASRIGSARQLGREASNFLDRVAPTESIAFRGGVVRGLVHDENAFAIAGDGMCGHAGLFGDAESVLAVGAAVLDALTSDTGFLGPNEMRPLVRDRPGGTLLAGFDRKTNDAPSSGSRLGPRTFGHLGFTGTSLWIDPDLAFVGVLLTNRVHPTREHIAIRAARPAAYDAMFDALTLEAGRLPR